MRLTAHLRHSQGLRTYGGGRPEGPGNCAKALILRWSSALRISLKNLWITG